MASVSFSDLFRHLEAWSMLGIMGKRLLFENDTLHSKVSRDLAESGVGGYILSISFMSLTWTPI